MKGLLEAFSNFGITEAQYHDMEYYKNQPNSNIVITFLDECRYPKEEWPLLIANHPPKLDEFIETRYVGVGRYYWNFLFYHFEPSIHLKVLYSFDLEHVKEFYNVYAEIPKSGKALLLAILIKIFCREEEDPSAFVHRYPVDNSIAVKDPRAPLYLKIAKSTIQYVEDIHAQYEVKLCTNTRGKTFKKVIEEWKSYVNEDVCNRYFYWILWLMLSGGEGSCDKSMKLRFAPIKFKC